MPVQNAVLSRDHPLPDEQPPAADDLSALRLLALPDLGPPFDDDPADQNGRRYQNARLTQAAGSRPAQHRRAAQPGPRWLCTAVEAA